MFEQTFKNIDDILHKDAGCSSELDYIEQTSWVLFLKYLDDLEKEKEMAADLSGEDYTPIIENEYKWEIWATPKTIDGKLDEYKALIGDDLKEFVDHKLFPYLKKFKTNAKSPDTIEYKIGEIFSELKNKLQSGCALRDVINMVDELKFRSKPEKHEMSHLYEDKIKNMGNAGRNGGEYYTPGPLIKTMVKVVAPKIGDKIYDGAVGSAGFLVEAYEYLRQKENLTAQDLTTLQKNSFYGKEKKSLAYIIGIMNMILHGIEAPNIVHTNTLAENLSDIQDKDRFDVILANPPFGGKERKEVQQNFPIKTGETAFLFLQHFIKILKAGGSAGVVVKNTFLSNTDNASTSLRKMLTESCNLHTVLDMPSGTFTGAGVKTVVLFFKKGEPTRDIWYYQLNLDRNLGKTNPLNEDDLAEFVELQKTKGISDNSWIVNINEVNQETFDLSAKNPNKKEENTYREPQKIIDEILSLDVESFESYLQSVFDPSTRSGQEGEDWEEEEIGNICETGAGGTPLKSHKDYYENGTIPWLRSGEVSKKNIYQSELYISEKGLINSSAKLFPKNTVLVAMYGATAGQVGILRFESSTNQAVCGILPNEKILPEFLYYVFLARKEKLVSQAVGNAQPNISQIKIKNTLIPNIEIEKQKEIVQKLDELQAETKRLEEIYQQKLNCLEELKQAILHKAFNGEL
jgi:type I restriction enzyme M protein